MALKRYSDEDALKILLKVEVHLDGNKDFLSACRTAPTPTISAKNRITYPAPRSGRLAWLWCWPYPTRFLSIYTRSHTQ